MEKNPMSVAVVMVAFVLAAGVGFSEAAVYKVGDAQGWTIGGPNYTAWALSKPFAVGDVVWFVYDNSLHNVLQVSKTNYDSCSVSSPIKTYKSGNDSITITSKGHNYFICGFPGHCGFGQKVDIKAASKSSSSSAAPSSSPSASPSPSPSPPSSPASSGGSGGSPAASSPQPSSGARAAPMVLAAALAVFSFAAMSSGLLMQQLL